MKVFWITSISLLTACGGGSGENSGTFIPYVQITCESGQAADCAGDDLPLFVGLIDGTAGSDCDDFLTGMSASQRQRTFLASGETRTRRRGIYLTGMINEWTDGLGARITHLTPGEYAVCALIDTNGNGEIDVNEPFAQSKVNLEVTGHDLNAWSPAYN